ncbi:MAG: D-alanine--D-alanine ligase [Cyanobacteria bacterium P01_C01_bin.120]
MSTLRILHLTGSAQDEFFCDLSRFYAKGCIAATGDPARYEFHIAYVTPDRQWRFPTSLSAADIAAAVPMDLSAAIATLQARHIDVALPQMFCLPGMTQYRSLLDLLGIPYVGNPAELMALTAHKAQAKAIVAAAGVNVPAGEVLRPGQSPTLAPPVVIKPESADNSTGVTLVRDQADYKAALKTAFSHANQVLVETYIAPGREVRCGILDVDGDLMALPLEEYPVNSTNLPIRNYADKLQRNDSGELTKSQPTSSLVALDDPITATVHTAAKLCHRALNCRHYSLFDFRIDSQGNPWFLEAGLYCSFSLSSVISTMAKAANIPLEKLLEINLKSALCRR